MIAATREASGVRDEVVGNVKKMASHVTGNERLAAEGEAQRQSGSLARKAD